MLIRALFPDLSLQSMLPAIDEVVMSKYEAYPLQYTDVFRMLTSSRSIEQTTEVLGFTDFKVIPEGGLTVYDDPVPGFNKTYLHAQYGLGFKVSKIAMDDDKFGVVKKLAAELGRSANETKNILAANVFNTGFTSAVGPDGQTLFSTSHPLKKSGGTQTNRASYATDPDVTSIQLALTDMRNTVDGTGKKVRIPPKQLIIPSTFEFLAAEILGGQFRSDTANRADNAFKKRSGMPSFENIKVWDYLTDPHAWFIEAEPEETELRWYEREAFNTLHDIEFDSRSVKTAGWMRSSCGYNGFYGVYGIPSS